MRGRLHIKTTQIPPFFCCIPVFLYSNPSFPYISHYTSQIFSHLRKNSQERGLSFSFYLFIFLIFVCTKGHPSSDSGPSKKNFMKRNQIQDDEEAECQR